MRRLLPLVIALAACGKGNSVSDGPTGVDGNGADGPSTADGAPAYDADLRGPITVYVYPWQPTDPQGGNRVAFIDPDGNVTETTTDLGGKATGMVAPGASVTTAYNETTFVLLETVRDVAPGDTIFIAPTAVGGGTMGSFTANVPDYPGSQTYDVYGPCDFGTNAAAGSGALTPVQFYVFSYCQTSAMDVIAIARDSNHAAIAWLDKSAVAYTDGGSTTLTGAWKPLQTLSFSYSNVAANQVSEITVAQRVPDKYGYESTGAASLGTEPATAQLDVPTAPTMQVVSTIRRAQGGGQQLYDVVDGTSTTYSMDLSTALVPFIDFATLDVPTRTVTVPMQGGGNDPGDLLTVKLHYTDTSAAMSFEWDVWSPPTGSIVLPDLPPDLRDFAPQVGDKIDPIYDNLYAADALTDWSQIRGNVFGAIDTYETGRAGLGRFVWSYPGVNLTGSSDRRTPR